LVKVNIPPERELMNTTDCPGLSDDASRHMAGMLFALDDTNDGQKRSVVRSAVSPRQIGRRRHPTHRLNEAASDTGADAASLRQGEAPRD
jgi:hypothetical protein